jgi:hypothetical protein
MGSDEIPPWESGWEERLRGVTRELGHPTFLDYLDSHIGDPYGKLLQIFRSRLGDVVPLMQIQALHMLDAAAVGKTREAAKDSLLRTLRQHIPKGWNKGKNVRQNRAFARAEWVLPDYSDETTALADRVWDEIATLNPPDDWCPSTLTDPILSGAFDRGWPAKTSPVPGLDAAAEHLTI